jgi:hypothetical protein
MGYRKNCLDHIGRFDGVDVRAYFHIDAIVLFGVDPRADIGGLQIEKSLFRVGVGDPDCRIVGFLGGRQIGGHLPDAVFQLDHRVFVVVQAQQLELGVELGHHIAGYHVDASLGQMQQDQREIAGTTAAGAETGVAAAIVPGPAPRDPRRQKLRNSGPQPYR